MSLLVGRLSNPPVRAAHLFAGAFACYAGVSVANEQASFYLITLIVAYIIGAYTSVKIEHVLYGFMTLTILLLAWSILTPWSINPNILGCMLVLGLAGSIGIAFWPFIPIALFGLLYTQSRGALVAAGFALFVAMWRRAKLTALVGLLVLIITVYFFSDGRGESIHSRLGIWRDTILHLTIWGQGFGSFVDAYALFPTHTNMTQVWAQHAYNDGLELIFELGIGAILLWFAIISAWATDDWALKLILSTFMILSLTYFPLYVPILGHLFFLCLGRLSEAR